MRISKDASFGEFLDAGSFFGTLLDSGCEYPVQQLIADYDRLGVAAGLVGSLRSIFEDVMKGAEEVSRLAKLYPDRLIPVAFVHPANFSSSPLADLTRIKETFGISIVGVSGFPSYYPVNWRSPVVHEIGTAAEKLGLLLVACISTEEDFLDLAAAWGKLSAPVIVRWMKGGRYVSIQSEISIAIKCSNFFLDVGNCTGSGDLARLVSCLGAERLLVSLNLPIQLGDTIRINFAENVRLPASAKNDIAAGSLARILERQRIFVRNQSERQVPSSRFLEEWSKLKAFPKNDIHWHPDFWNLGETRVDQQKIWDDFNYKNVILFSSQALNYDLASGNQSIHKWMDLDPRARGLIVINPLQREKSFLELEKYALNTKFVGVKTIQDPYQLGLDAEEYRPFLEFCAERDLPILAHLGGIEAAARLYPSVRFVAAHANWGRARHLASIPNIYFDFATSHANAWEHQLDAFIREVGVARVMFGSDSQLMDPSWNLSKLISLGLTSYQIQRVLSDNAYCVFGRLKGEGF